MSNNVRALEVLEQWIEHQKRLADGRFELELRREISAEIYRLVMHGWEHRTSPYDKSWKGRAGSVGIYKTGALKSSVRVDDEPSGLRASIGGPQFGRHSLASILQYGGWIRAKLSGGKASRWGARYKSRPLTPGQARGAGAGKPMRFKVGGRWVSKYAVHIRANKLLPDPGELPKQWEISISEVIARVLARAGVQR